MSWRIEWTPEADALLREAIARGDGPTAASEALMRKTGIRVSAASIATRMSELSAARVIKRQDDYPTGKLGYCAYCGRLRVLRNLRCKQCAGDMSR